jgi:hypothetical protein
MRKIEFIAAVAALALATPVLAQGRGRGNGGVPPGQRPAAGMCRIWIDGVPPGHQPAPTDCATAEARVPYNGRVVYGDRTTDRGRRVYESNGQVITNGDGCVRRADVYGRIQTICPNGTYNRGTYDRGTYDRDGRVSSSRVYRNGDRVVTGKEKGKRKIKHGKHDGDRDYDRRHDRDREEDRLRR